MRIHWFLLCTAITYFSCANDKEPIEGSLTEEDLTHTEFVAEKWRVVKDGEFPHREGMLKDLMNDGHLRAMDQTHVIKELGPPERVNGDYVYYTVEQKRIGLFPLHTKSLVIKFQDNGPVEWMKIHE